MVDNARRLKYPNDRVLYLLQEVSDRFDDLTSFQPLPFTDAETRIQVTYNINAQEFKRLLSALVVGSEQAYPDLVHEMFLLFANPGVAMIDCEQVADCVESQLAFDPETNAPVNQEFYNSITQTINQSGFGNPNHVSYTQTSIPDRNPSGHGDTEIAKLANCDTDVLWGAIRHGIVQRLDDNARDLLEDLTGIPNVSERLQVFIDIVPVVGDILEAVAVQITEIVPDILDLYNSYSSESTLDDIACEIFSLVCSDCRYPTYKEVFDIYWAKSGMTQTFEEMTLEHIAEQVLELILAPAETAYGMMVTWALWVLNVQGAWNGLNGTQSLHLMIELGEDFANDNWRALCETCLDDWQIDYFDFLVSPSGWSKQPQIGVQQVGGKWTSGVGWHGTEEGHVGTFITRIVIDIQAGWRLRGIGFHYVGTGIDLSQTGGSFRPVAGSNTGVVNVSFSTGTNYNRSNCLLAVNQGFTQVTIVMLGNNSNLAITKAFLTYDRDYGKGELASSRAIC